MPKYTENLGLRLPLEKEYFNINQWNTNMRLLDEAYALLRDESGAGMALSANLVTYDNVQSGLEAVNVQEALDSISAQMVDTNVNYVTVNSDKIITVSTMGHSYVVLTFGNTVYDVEFVADEEVPGIDFVWEGDEPEFEPNSVYELSFLRLDCKWFKR